MSIETPPLQTTTLHIATEKETLGAFGCREGWERERKEVVQCHTGKCQGAERQRVTLLLGSGRGNAASETRDRPMGSVLRKQENIPGSGDTEVKM